MTAPKAPLDLDALTRIARGDGLSPATAAELIAEARRLREALQEIDESKWFGQSGRIDWTDVFNAVEIARRALFPGEPTGIERIALAPEET